MPTPTALPYSRIFNKPDLDLLATDIELAAAIGGVNDVIDDLPSTYVTLEVFNDFSDTLSGMFAPTFHTHSAADLPATVAYKNQNNNFTQPQTVSGVVQATEFHLWGGSARLRLDQTSTAYSSGGWDFDLFDLRKVTAIDLWDYPASAIRNLRADNGNLLFNGNQLATRASNSFVGNQTINGSLTAGYTGVSSSGSTEIRNNFGNAYLAQYDSSGVVRNSLWAGISNTLQATSFTGGISVTGNVTADKYFFGSGGPQLSKDVNGHVNLLNSAGNSYDVQFNVGAATVLGSTNTGLYAKGWLSGLGGVKVGGFGSNIGGLWSGGVTPGSTNYAMSLFSTTTIVNSPSTDLYFATGGNIRTTVTTTGDIIPTGAVKFGASGSQLKLSGGLLELKNSTDSAYAAMRVSQLSLNGTNYIVSSGSSILNELETTYMYSPEVEADSLMATAIKNQTGWTAFDLTGGNATFSPGTAGFLRFEGSTASHVGLKRDGTTLQVRLGNDFGLGSMEMGNLTAWGSISTNEIINTLGSYKSDFHIFYNADGSGMGSILAGDIYPALLQTSTAVVLAPASPAVGTLLRVGTLSYNDAFGVVQYGATASTRYSYVRGEGLYGQTEAGVNKSLIGLAGFRAASDVGYEFSSTTTLGGAEFGMYRTGVNAAVLATTQAGTTKADLSLGNLTVGGSLTTSTITTASGSLLLNPAAYVRLPTGKGLYSDNGAAFNYHVGKIGAIAGVEIGGSLDNAAHLIKDTVGVLAFRNGANTADTPISAGAGTFSGNITTNTIQSASGNIAISPFTGIVQLGVQVATGASVGGVIVDNLRGFVFSQYTNNVVNGFEFGLFRTGVNTAALATTQAATTKTSLELANLTASGNVVAGSGSLFPITIGQNGSIGSYLSFGNGVVTSGFAMPGSDQLRPTSNGALSDNTLILGHSSHRFKAINVVTVNATTINTASIFASAGSAASPTIRLGTDTTTGFWQPAANQIGVTVQGTDLFRWATGGLVYCFGSVFQAYGDIMFGSSGGPRLRNSSGSLLVRNNADTADGIIAAGAFSASNSVYLGPAATLRLADYVNIQSGGNWGLVDVAPMTGSQSGLMRIYNGLRDLTNYERLEIGQQTAGDAVIRTAAGGTGTRRNLALDAPTVNMGATGTRGLKVGKAVTLTNFVEINPDKITVQGDPFKMWGYQSSFMSLAQSHAVGVSGAGLDSPGLKFVGGWNAGGTEYSPAASILFKPSSTDKGSLCFSSGYEGLRITTTENRPAVLQVNSPTISTAMVNITTSWTGKKGLLVQGVASQTENLIEVKDNTGAALFAVSPTQVRITHATNPEILLSGPGGGGTSAGNIKFTGSSGTWNYARINGEVVIGGAFGTGALSFYVVNSGVEQLGMLVTGPGQASFGDLTGSAVAQVAMRNYSYGGITYPLVLDNHSNSTDGVGIQFMGTGTSGTALTTGKIDVRKTALTSTTTTADLVISLPNASATVAEVFRIKGNGDINAIGTVTIGGTTAPNIDIRNASNSLYAQFNGTARSFYAGGDAFAVLTADGSSRLFNNGRLCWNAGSTASSGIVDIALGRAGVNEVGVYIGVSGSTLGKLLASRYRSFGTTDSAQMYWSDSNVSMDFRNAADSANVAVRASAFYCTTLSGMSNSQIFVSTQTCLESQSWAGFGGLRMGSGQGIYWSSTTAFSDTPDASITRPAASTIRLPNTIELNTDTRQQRAAAGEKTSAVYESSIPAWQTVITEKASPAGPQLGFYGATPTAKQDLPTNPTNAQIAEVLRILGLVNLV